LKDTGYHNADSIRETREFYKKYYDKFIKIDPPDIRTHPRRIKFFAILIEVLYPYYLEKNRGSVSKETFSMVIFFHYFSVRDTIVYPPSSDLIFRDKSKKADALKISLFLTEMEPSLSELVTNVHGGKPKTKKNKLRKMRKTRKTRKTRTKKINK
jgi:hypothetical protein